MISYNALLSVIWDLMRILHFKTENEKRHLIAAQENARSKGTGNKYGHKAANFLKNFTC